MGDPRPTRGGPGILQRSARCAGIPVTSDQIRGRHTEVKAGADFRPFRARDRAVRVGELRTSPLLPRFAFPLLMRKSLEATR